MAFRNDREAAQARADALQRELDDKEAELARAQAEIAALKGGDPRLVRLDGDEVGRIYQLEGVELTIGRAGADITIPNSALSRRHARLFRRGSTWMIEDLGSANGVTVDGNRTQNRALAPGSIVELGGGVRLRYDGPPAGRSLAPKTPPTPSRNGLPVIVIFALVLALAAFVYFLL